MICLFSSAALKPIKERLGLSAGSGTTQPGKKSEKHERLTLLSGKILIMLLLSPNLPNSRDQHGVKESSRADPHQNSGGDPTGEGSKVSVSVKRWPLSRGSRNQQYQIHQGSHVWHHHKRPLYQPHQNFL